MPTALSLPARRVVVRRFGGADALVAEDGEALPPGAGEVRIRQRAVGVNFIDVYQRRGWLPAMLAEGGTPGMEAAGSVVDTGPGVAELLPGDRVAYVGPQPGAYCTLRTLPARWVVRLPPAVDDEAAAALLLKGLTAHALLHDIGRVGPGTRLLVHAAAGGLGLLLCAWARRLGATVVGTVSSHDKARLAREYGCERVIVTADHRFADAVRHAVGGADVVIDGLGAAAQAQNLAVLAPRGHWISIGQASGPLAPIDPDDLVARSLSFSRPVVFDYVATAEALATRARALWAALADGSLRLPPIERHGLESAAAAHARLESRQTTGALVLLA
jgi:NADPH:quinone reductase